LIQQLLEAARKRFDAQKAYYEEGRITLDRFIDACQQLESAESLAAKGETERKAVKEHFLELLKEIENREHAELTVGRGTQADVTEIELRRLQTEIALKKTPPAAFDIDAILHRLSELERKVDLIERGRAGK
jgi:hypothetical protein